MSNPGNSEKIWDKIFIELSLRALRKLHIDYGMWGLGQKEDESNFDNINNGPGIELALETHVGAAITHEFINSAFTNGFYFKKKNRRYEIHREVSFKKKDKGKFLIGASDEKKRIAIDLLIRRFEYNKEDEIVYCNPSLIQLKRAQPIIPRIYIGGRENISVNYEGILNDLRYLETIYKYHLKEDLETGSKEYRYESAKDMHLYSLFWGVLDSISKPEEIIAHIKVKYGYSFKDTNTKYSPLNYKKGTNPPEVKDWLWVSLVEMDTKLIQQKNEIFREFPDVNKLGI